MKYVVAAIIIALPILAWTHPTVAHEDASWIMNNPATSWCCGPKDCAPLAYDDVKVTATGILVKATGETIPYSELKPSIDNRWWRCHRPGGKTRCLFRPPFGS